MVTAIEAVAVADHEGRCGWYIVSHSGKACAARTRQRSLLLFSMGTGRDPQELEHCETIISFPGMLSSLPWPRPCIRNGRIVNATAHRTPTFPIADAGKIRDIAPGLRPLGDNGPPGRRCCPAHTHLDTPFGGTTSSDDFETGTAAAFGGRPPWLISRFRHGTPDALDIWWKKADGRATIDYGLHMIVTDLPDAGLEDTTPGSAKESPVSSFSWLIPAC